MNWVRYHYPDFSRLLYTPEIAVYNSALQGVRISRMLGQLYRPKTSLYNISLTTTNFVSCHAIELGQYYSVQSCPDHL